MLKSQVELWAETHQSEPPDPAPPDPDPKNPDTMADDDVPAPDDE